MPVVQTSPGTDSKTYLSSVSPKGQITLPKPIRDLMGVKPRDRVAIRVEGGVTKLEPVGATLESIFQSVPALPKKLSWKEITDIAHEEHAQKADRRGT